jgi:hypothetical protein
MLPSAVQCSDLVFCPARPSIECAQIHLIRGSYAPRIAPEMARVAPRRPDLVPGGVTISRIDAWRPGWRFRGGQADLDGGRVDCGSSCWPGWWKVERTLEARRPGPSPAGALSFKD